MLDLFTDSSLYSAECQLFALFGGGFLVAFVVARVRRSRPGLSIEWAIAAAFLVRIAAAFGLNQTPIAGELRGGDELIFLADAQGLAGSSIGAEASLTALTEKFHVFFFSVNYRVFDDLPDMMLRFEMITLAVIGIALLSAAVYELAGPK